MVVKNDDLPWHNPKKNNQLKQIQEMGYECYKGYYSL